MARCAATGCAEDPCGRSWGAVLTQGVEDSVGHLCLEPIVPEQALDLLAAHAAGVVRANVSHRLPRTRMFLRDLMPHLPHDVLGVASDADVASVVLGRRGLVARAPRAPRAGRPGAPGALPARGRRRRGPRRVAAEPILGERRKDITELMVIQVTFAFRVVRAQKVFSPYLLVGRAS